MAQSPPRSPEVERLEAARSALNDGNNVKAIEHIRALFVGSPHIEALFYGGIVSERLGKAEEARTWYEKVLLLDPSHAGARTRHSALARPPTPQPHVAPPGVEQGFGVYSALKNDPSPLSRSAAALIEKIHTSTRPRVLDAPGALFLLIVLLLLIVPLLLMLSAPVEYVFVIALLFFIAPFLLMLGAPSALILLVVLLMLLVIPVVVFAPRFI